MVFKSKMDRTFRIFISISILIIGISCFFPVFLDEEIPPEAMAILIGVFILIVAFLLWMLFGIQYVFNEEYLLVKGGPFRSRIAYENITKVSPTRDIYTGYRLSTSTDGIEIFYKTGFSGSVKISPKEKELFLSELKKHCPHAKFEF